MKEQHLYKALQAQHSSKGVLFRNNTGTAYQGIRAMVNSREVLKDIRPISFGLCIGSSDLIGWTEMEITPEMIGTKIAVFTAVEVKFKGGKTSKEQRNFINQVITSGGIANVVRWDGYEFKNDD